MSPHAALDLETRRRLYQLVQDYPGLHVRELARQLETSVALVEYHLGVLAGSGLVRVQEDAGFHRVFAAGERRSGLSAADRTTLAVLRKRIPLRITLYLLDDDEPVAHSRIAKDLGLGKSKLSFHLRNLEASQVLRKAPDGRYEPVDRRRLLGLLLENRPTPDLREEFADLWLSLYGSR